MLYHGVKIGSLELNGNIFLAPVAGYSDRAFRSVCIEHGAAFTYTEMVSAEALVRGNGKTETLMNRAANEKAYAVQIFGSEGGTLAKAARIVLEKSPCECIDINCGCPVPKIIKTGAGSSLTRDPDRLYAVTKAVVESVEGSVPVTVKIRSGWDSGTLTWKEAADAALSAGVSAITMHPRTRAQGYEGKADWTILKALVDFVGGRVPGFGSGDLFKPEDARAMIEQTGCSAVMFARGAMGNPFIFTETKQLLETGSFDEVRTEERIRTGFRELSLLIDDLGEESACREMRKRFCAYTKGIRGGAEMRLQLVHASTAADYHKILDNVYSSIEQIRS
ncbi:MAG TPA: tRNA dihydrouridine synthase DusB [Treponema sp.]|nr:tRNA dihydrouridine synthase DusB [Treponema sp.]